MARSATPGIVHAADRSHSGAAKTNGVVSHWISCRRVPRETSCGRIANALGVDVDTVLASAGHRPSNKLLALDDPKMEIIDLIKRVRLTDDRLTGLRG